VVVVLFHLGVGGFEGGFVGVDVFFVISGFLITGIIRDEVLATGGFSFSSFYIRRIRRLMPALFATLLGCAVVGALVLSPHHLKHFGESLLASLISVSNIYFWKEAGYFDSDSALKPLLHTWSLSVEEQFYLLWPAALVFLFRRTASAKVGVALAWVAGISFTLNLAAVHLSTDSEGAVAAFYLLPFRVFEFVIGALMVWITPRQPRNKAVLEPLLLVGLGLIAYAVFAYTEEVPFPSYSALVPCLGAALAIYAGQARIVGKLLRNGLGVAIGRISYSLYLTHWPVIVFWSYASFGSLDAADRAGMLALAVVLALVLYRYVETPFRMAPQWAGGGRAKPLRPVIVMPVVLAVIGASMVAHAGWAWRIPVERQMFGVDIKDYHRSQFGGAGIPANTMVTLGNAAASRPAFLIAGDSLSHQYANALHQLLSAHGLAARGLFHHGCLIAPDATRYRKGVEEEKCSSAYDKLRTMLDTYPDVDLFLAHDWDEYRAKLGPRGGNAPYQFSTRAEYNAYVVSQIEKLIEHGGSRRRYFLIGMPQIFSEQRGRTLVDCLSRPSIASADCAMYSRASDPEINRVLAGFARQRSNVYYIEPRDALCVQGQCSNMVDGYPIHSDGEHLSMKGAAIVVDHFKWLFLGRAQPSNVVDTDKHLRRAGLIGN